MILHGNQRGGAKDLALHLLKDENEHVELHELRGFVSQNLVSALNEAYAVSRGTKAKQFLFSLSLNPPKNEDVPTAVFEDAIERIEDKLGLSGQPRAIVFHEKEGRRHCHAVWSRIDTQAMKAIPMSFSKDKLMQIARDLYREHGWTMPRGFMNSQERDPRNFTLAQWQQAKRQGKDPRAIKEVFQECWAVSDSREAFAQALKERGYILAKGDRRGFVALDYACEVYAISKWTDVREKDVKAKLGDPANLPSVAETRDIIARDMTAHLLDLQTQQSQAVDARLAAIEDAKQDMVREQKAARVTLGKAQQERQRKETRQRQERFNKGLRGFLDRFTGHHRRIKKQNEQEAEQAAIRDQNERDALIFEQRDQRHRLQARTKRLERFHEDSDRSLSADLSQYEDIREQRREVATFSQPKAEYQPRKPSQTLER